MWMNGPKTVTDMWAHRFCASPSGPYLHQLHCVGARCRGPLRLSAAAQPCVCVLRCSTQADMAQCAFLLLHSTVGITTLVQVRKLQRPCQVGQPFLSVTSLSPFVLEPSLVASSLPVTSRTHMEYFLVSKRAIKITFDIQEGRKVFQKKTWMYSNTEDILGPTIWGFFRKTVS